MHTHRFLPLAAAALVLTGAGAALAQSAPANRSLAACRSISDAAARLACYDALPLPVATPAAAAAPAVPVAPATASVAPAAPAAPAARTAVAPSAVAPSATSPATPAAAAAANFGIERPVQGELQDISSRFEGDFEGWGPTTRMKLANGQVWQVVDGSSAAIYLRSPRVTVKRALLGGYVMEFEGSNRTAKVRRVE